MLCALIEKNERVTWVQLPDKHRGKHFQRVHPDHRPTLTRAGQVQTFIWRGQIAKGAVTHVLFDFFEEV